MLEQREYTPMEIEEHLKRDDLSILLKIPENYFNAGKARNLIQRFPHHTLSIYAFCEEDVQASPLVIASALPGLAKARRLDLLPSHIRSTKETMIKAVEASSEAYFSISDELKNDLDFHMQISTKVHNFLEIPMSSEILSNPQFLFNILEGTAPTYIPSQILNSNIPHELKSSLLKITRKFEHEGNISFEQIKFKVLSTLEEKIQENKKMEVKPGTFQAKLN